MKSITLTLMTSWIALMCIGQAEAQTCTVAPATVSNFDATSFAGNWHMQSSTFYAKDEFGCIKLSFSEPNTNGKVDAGVRMIQLWSFNPLQSGTNRVQSYSLSTTSSGVMTYKSYLVINNTFYQVLDTDYTNYAIVYECTKNYPRFLNFRNDDVHILTRTESVTDANLLTYKTTAESKVTGSKARFEDLSQTQCLRTGYSTKISEMFTDPDNFFRKW